MSDEIKKTLKSVPKGWAVTFFVCFAVDIVLLVTSFLMPPQGVIDPSVLAAAAELFAFPTLYTAYECISKGISARYTFNIGGTEIGIETNPKNKTDE